MLNDELMAIRWHGRWEWGQGNKQGRGQMMRQDSVRKLGKLLHWRRMAASVVIASCVGMEQGASAGHEYGDALYRELDSYFFGAWGHTDAGEWA